MKTKNYRYLIHIFLICSISAGLLSALPSRATGPAEFQLGWDANEEVDLDGYEVYFRKGVPGSKYKFLAEVYVDELEDPDNPMVTITDLYNGLLTDTILPVVRMAELANNTTYHFALKAFDIQGNYSEFSEELCVKVIGSTVTECPSAAGGGESGGIDDGSGNDAGDSSADSASNAVTGGSGGCFIATSSWFRDNFEF